MMNAKDLWNKCVEFHGHSCSGLTIGFKAALYAMDLLDFEFSDNEQIVCVAENDGCSIDAIQIVTGCSVGKGNLLFHMTGKQAYTFYSRADRKAVRLVLKPAPAHIGRAESLVYYQMQDPEDMFDIKPVTLRLPTPSRSFQNVVCEACGESTAEHYIRLQGGKQVCPDCWKPYDRFHV